MSAFYGSFLVASAVLAPSYFPAPADACSLLTKEIAAAALGEAVQGPKVIAEREGGMGTVSSCEYTGSGYNMVRLNLTKLKKDLAPAIKSKCRASPDLAGVGDLACWYNEKHGELHAFKGDVFVNVQMTRGSNQTEAIKTVAKKAIDALK